MPGAQGTATDEQIERHRARVLYETQMELDRMRTPAGPRAVLGGGVAASGERWTGQGWAYCADRRHCRAEATMHRKERIER